MSAPVYPVSRYFIGLPASLDIGLALRFLQIEVLRICAPAPLTMPELREEIKVRALATEEQAHAMARTVYVSLRASRDGRLMDDTFLDRSQARQPMRYFVTRAGREFLKQNERTAA